MKHQNGHYKYVLCSLPPQFKSVYKTFSSAYYTPEREQHHVSQNATRTDSLGFMESMEKTLFRHTALRKQTSDFTSGI